MQPSRALGRGQVRMIVAHARRRDGVARVLCTHTASQHRVAAWRHISSHLLALTTATSGLTCPSVCALPRPSRSCHAAELPIVQPDIRHSTDVRSAPGAQVDPLSLGITEGIPFVLFGFRSAVWVSRSEVVARFRSPGRLTLHRGRAWTFMPADLAGQNAPRRRTFSKILGSGDRPYIK